MVNLGLKSSDSDSKALVGLLLLFPVLNRWARKQLLKQTEFKLLPRLTALIKRDKCSRSAIKKMLWEVGKDSINSAGLRKMDGMKHQRGETAQMYTVNFLYSFLYLFIFGIN